MCVLFSPNTKTRVNKDLLNQPAGDPWKCNSDPLGQGHSRTIRTNQLMWRHVTAMSHLKTLCCIRSMLVFFFAQNREDTGLKIIYRLTIKRSLSQGLNVALDLLSEHMTSRNSEYNHRISQVLLHGSWRKATQNWFEWWPCECGKLKLIQKQKSHNYSCTIIYCMGVLSLPRAWGTLSRL